MIGIGASPGIAIGKVKLKSKIKLDIEKAIIEDSKSEIIKLHFAREKSRKEIMEMHESTLKNIGEKEAQIFDAHIMILDDAEMFGQIEAKIEKESVSSSWAVKEVSGNFISLFDKMEDQYMRERAADIRDVSERLIKNIMGVEESDISDLNEPFIIIADDITPSDTAKMDPKNVLGFVTARGGKTAHSAIMARSMEIPAIVGANGILDLVKDYDYIVFDGNTGEIFINPSGEIVQKYMKILEDDKLFKNSLNKLIGERTVTGDGRKIELAANIGTAKDLDGVLRNDAEGIGLFRTEFLYMDRSSIPSEYEQFEVYREVAEAMNGKSVVIRTLDIGGDKELSYLNLPKEMNPFLGYRAIRLCLDQKEIFLTQLRALLRASIFGNIKIMFPMISSIGELRNAKEILAEAKESLKLENIQYSDDVEVGMMIEVPSAAIISDLLAKEVDFFSIGTNDLIQYTVAVDRGNESLEYLYSPFHPAVLRLIKMIIENGHKEGIWVGMCGELAGNPDIVPLLAAMEIDELSMSAASILRSRYILKNTDLSYFKTNLDYILNMATAEEIRDYLVKC